MVVYSWDVVSTISGLNDYGGTYSLAVSVSILSDGR